MLSLFMFTQPNFWCTGSAQSFLVLEPSCRTPWKVQEIVTSQRDPTLPKAAWLHAIRSSCYFSPLDNTISHSGTSQDSPSASECCCALLILLPAPISWQCLKTMGSYAWRHLSKEVLEPALRKSIINLALQPASCILPHKTELAACTIKSKQLHLGPLYWYKQGKGMWEAGFARVRITGSLCALLAI